MIEVKEKYIKDYGFITTNKAYKNYKIAPSTIYNDEIINAYIASYNEMKINFQKEFSKRIDRIMEQHNSNINDLIFDSLRKLNIEVRELNTKLEKTISDITNK